MDDAVARCLWYTLQSFEEVLEVIDSIAFRMDERWNFYLKHTDVLRL
jgi:hypothetical protein